jgi:class 3 adenylate cyclase
MSVDGVPRGVDGGSEPLPRGTVTFLLTDIEGSTRLWSRCPDAMRDAVVETYAILHRAINDHDGVLPVEQGEGDSVVGACPRASDAVEAALQAQLEIRAHAWPVGLQLRVRMALHTAEAQLRDERNYFGVALSRCARLRALAHGGQTLLSRATGDLAADGLPPGARLVDCSVVALRDLERPEHVFALDHPALDDGAAQFAPVATAGVNLPDPLTPFVGRERELRQLRDGLNETRLLTLTGAGGIGKTRLAAQAASGARDRFAGGVWWVGLAAVTAGELVDEALADALGVRASPASSALDAACARLADSRALVVLDNCEHVGEACADVTERLLRACPAVVVMATSRMPLGVAGEMDWRVPSAGIRPSGASSSPQAKVLPSSPPRAAYSHSASVGSALPAHVA